MEKSWKIIVEKEWSPVTTVHGVGNRNRKTVKGYAENDLEKRCVLRRRLLYVCETVNLNLILLVRYAALSFLVPILLSLCLFLSKAICWSHFIISWLAFILSLTHTYIYTPSQKKLNCVPHHGPAIVCCPSFSDMSHQFFTVLWVEWQHSTEWEIDWKLYISDNKSDVFMW